MLIINYGQEYYDEGLSSHVVDMTLTYLVDYEDSYHWVIGQDSNEIPFPYTIMIPHVGRIDKGDTLSIEYQCCEAAGLMYEKLTKITDYLSKMTNGELNFDDII